MTPIVIQSVTRRHRHSHTHVASPKIRQSCKQVWSVNLPIDIEMMEGGTGPEDTRSRTRYWAYRPAKASLSPKGPSSAACSVAAATLCPLLTDGRRATADLPIQAMLEGPEHQQGCQCCAVESNPQLREAKEECRAFGKRNDDVNGWKRGGQTFCLTCSLAASSPDRRQTGHPHWSGEGGEKRQEMGAAL